MFETLALAQGWAILFVRGPYLKFFLAIWATLCDKPDHFNMIHKEIVFKKLLRGPYSGLLAGRIWPAGRTLPTPALASNQYSISFI